MNTAESQLEITENCPPVEAFLLEDESLDGCIRFVWEMFGSRGIKWVAFEKLLEVCLISDRANISWTQPWPRLSPSGLVAVTL